VEVAGVPELVRLIAAPLLEVLLPLEPLPQADTTSPAATVSAIASCRE
jgi:hypothetical protein